MGLSARTNVASLVAQRYLGRTTDELQNSMAKLTSGNRINKAADDAAGLAISDNLLADVRSLKVAKRNALDGVSLLQTTEGGLVETGNMLSRLRELAIQAASDTLGDRERGLLDREFLQLKNEIDRIATSTEFNGTRLLIGNNDVGELAKGSNPYPLEIQIAGDYYKNVDSKDQINPINIIRLDFSKLNGLTHGEASLNLGANEEGLRVDKKENAQSSISMLDNAINQVNDYRSYIGAMQNRLSSTMNNLGIQVENLSTSASRILETDFAAETAELTKANILQQAGTAVLANANSQPQIILSLLGGK